VHQGLVILVVPVFQLTIIFNAYVHQIGQEKFVTSTLLLIHVLQHHVSIMPIALASVMIPIFTVIVVMIEQDGSVNGKLYNVHVHLRLVSMVVVALLPMTASVVNALHLRQDINVS
jgi:hypothetical protein